MNGWSFHSVKGGVGKSTLSTRCALALARKRPERRVYLVDLDLTGTSLADGLPLRAPDFGFPPNEPLNWRRPRIGSHSVDESRNRATARACWATPPRTRA